MRVATLPTTDLYFQNSCGAWIRRWWKGGSLRKIGNNAFFGSGLFILIRRDEPDLMERALKHAGKLIYVIDDDIDGAAQSPGLPPSYKARLAHFANHYYDRLLRRADTIVASSDVLAAQLRLDPRVQADIVRADPFWALPLADQNHFCRALDGALDIVHLGTASHAGALAKIGPAVISVLDRFVDSRFTFIGPYGGYPELEAHTRVRRLDVMSWRRYRRWLPRQRFHLALYPLEQTPFDKARSANKLFEHAIIGAVGIYPQDWRPARMIGDGAILAPSDPAEWTEAICQVMTKPDLNAIARIAATALAGFHDGVTQRVTWAKLLDLETNGFNI